MEVPTLDISFPESNYQDVTFKLLAKIRPQWKPDDVKFKVFTEGISNKLFMCSTPDKGLDDGVVVRIYGTNSEVLIDREAEIKNMCLLKSIGLGAALYARFNNGIAYEFIPGECLDMDTVRDGHIGSLVAKEMVRMHGLKPKDFKAAGMSGEIMPMLIPTMIHWTDIMPTSFTDPARNNKLLTELPSQSALNEEVWLLESHLVKLNSPVVFSHNDTLLKNIVYNKKADRVFLIDYEYGGFNFEAFDIGNHFCEWAGIDEVDYSLYPDKDVQCRWIRCYLQHKADFEESTEEVTDEQVHTFYVQANKFALAAHMMWGLWALIQAKYSTIDFDYLDYAKIRLGEYFAKKDTFLALE